MAEIQTQLTPYNVCYECDSCKQANVILNSSFFNSDNVLMYSYKCPNCNIDISLQIVYPHIIYR